MDYKEACAQVGYVSNEQCPVAPVWVWYAYKDGKATECSTEKGAKTLSKNTDRVMLNKAEIDAWWNVRRKLEAKAIDIWHEALKKEHIGGEITEKVFNLCYNRAYEDSHSEGYDAVAQKLDDYIDFSLAILKSVTKDVVARR